MAMEKTPILNIDSDEDFEVPSSDAESGPLLPRSQDTKESKLVRLLPVLDLMIPTGTSIMLYCFGDWQSTGMLYGLVKNHQAMSQILVQTISHILGLFQVSSLCAVLNLSMRYRIIHNSVALQVLSFSVALSTARIDLYLPRRLLLLNAAFIAATFLPAALWAPAISPVTVLTSQGIENQLLPAFTDGTKAYWDSQFQARGPGRCMYNINDHCSLINDKRGLIPSCPVPTLQGLLLLSASSATTLDGGPRNHSKLDNSNWEFFGRSFGAGSSVGKSDERIADDRVLYYNYTESGYVANVSCINNSTSDFRFRLERSVGKNISIFEYQRTHHPEMPIDHSWSSWPDMWTTYSIYYVDGYLPNSIIGTPELYPSISWHEGYENVTAWAAVANNDRNMIAVAAGNRLYRELDQVQCEVFFRPMVFDVTVNRIQRSIAVEAQPSVEAEDIDPSGHLRANVMHSINLLSRMSPSLYVSVLGETLSRNVERMQKQRPDLNETEAVTSAVAESFTAIIDDILVAYGASQIVNAQDTTSTGAQGLMEAVQLGHPFYKRSVLMLNFLIILIVLFETARTRCWKNLTKFNILDIKSAIVAASAGGSGIVKAVWARHRSQGTQWAGDPTDGVVRHTRVDLGLHSTLSHVAIPAIVIASDEASIERRGRTTRLDSRDSNSKALYRSRSE